MSALGTTFARMHSRNRPAEPLRREAQTTRLSRVAAWLLASPSPGGRKR